MADIKIITGGGGGGGGYTTIQENGSNLPQESTLNFVGAAAVVTDDPGSARTNVTFAMTLDDIAGLTPTLGTAIVGNGTHFVSGTASNISANYTPINYTATSIYVEGNLQGIDTELGDIIATGVLGPFSAGSVLYSNGTIITQDNANFNWNDANYTLALTQPSSLLTAETVLKITSDPSGSHGHGQHIELSGNPGGGATIFRTDGGLNDSWIQIYGGGMATSGGAIYINGNNSTGGGTGGVQTTFGLNTSSFQMYDYTESILLFQLNNAGVLNLPMLTANSALATDGSNNVTAIASSTAGYVLTSNGAGSAPTFQPATGGGGFSWVVVTSSTLMTPNTGYIVNAVSQITLTLPLAFAAGSEVRIVGYAGGWTIDQASSQSIAWGNTSTTLGTSGHLTSTEVTDCLDIVAVNANTTFVVADSNGNITVV